MAEIQFKNLIDWSEEQYSELPWRQKRTLYKTLVSEIMLQQTTVGTVLNHFERFIKEYPTIFDLAKSTEEEICISWKGLGYYRRARNLRNLAIQIVEKYQGAIPTDLVSLQNLKGIGPYTASALVAIGADKKALAVDANLERVLSRYYGIAVEKGPKLQKEIWAKFETGKILNEINDLSARALNEAFMDLGRIICQSKKASCLICPLGKNCVAKKVGALTFPREIQKEKGEELFIDLMRVVVKDKKNILVFQKSDKEWLSGQWEIPTFILSTNDDSLSQYPRLAHKKILGQYKEWPSIKTTITKYKINNYFSEMNLDEFEKLVSKIDRDYLFKKMDSSLNASTATLKILDKITKNREKV